MPTDQARLVQNLAMRLGQRPGVAAVRVLETHISFVLLTGGTVYKIRKAVSFGFLDFSTLERREHDCHEEIRLNRRCAPELYRGVVAITGTPAAPDLGGAGAAIEYAVAMREFPQDQLGPALLDAGVLGAAGIDEIATELAVFHARCARAGPGSGRGDPSVILKEARENFADLRLVPSGAVDLARLQALADWTEREFLACAERFRQRRDEGRIRECHGDLHLGNIARIDGKMTFFDCIEFSDELRWVDVMSELAFLVMDLLARNRARLAYRLLNAYLEATGDYDGLGVLRFYVVYRALVRAKVSGYGVMENPADAESRADLRAHLDLAWRCAQARRPAVILMHGLSGSGKSTVAQALLETLGAIRLRSDVERKRLAGLDARARTRSAVAGGLYTGEVTETTYHRLLMLAQCAVDADCTAIVDATFLRRHQRDLFRDWARKRNVRYAVVDCVAPVDVLRARVVRRAREAGDPSEADSAVLEYQLATQDPLAGDERRVVTWDAQRPPGDAARPGAWAPLLSRLRK